MQSFDITMMYLIILRQMHNLTSQLIENVTRDTGKHLSVISKLTENITK